MSAINTLRHVYVKGMSNFDTKANIIHSKYVILLILIIFQLTESLSI